MWADDGSDLVSSLVVFACAFVAGKSRSGVLDAFVKDLVTHDLPSKAEVVRVAQDLKLPL